MIWSAWVQVNGGFGPAVPLKLLETLLETNLAGSPPSHYPLHMDSREAFIALNLIEGVGPIRVRSLLEQFGDAPDVFNCPLAIAEQEARLEAERQPIGRPVAGKP
jgi:hypothetical protein